MTKISLTERRLLLFSVLSLALSLSVGNATAKVSGVCGNCHTMHNSQDGAAVAHSGSGAGWAADGTFSSGVATDTPLGYLLIADCVGCHSATSDQTIVEIGENRIPIVFNTGAYPSKALAGGNFYNVSRGETYDGYGHNVYGISEHDAKLTTAPGNNRCGTANSCHNTLAVAPTGQNDDRGGCQGCHYNVYHHQDNNRYRFLNSHDEQFGAYVEGVEHASWEHPDHIAANDDHNYYTGVDRDDIGQGGTLELKQTHGISSYCAGCHNTFHSIDGIGADTWLRHPTDIVLPEEGEYAQYDPVTAYELQSPVAWIDPASPQRDEAIVMCLSCHRVHGSEYPDILRWDYSEMIANQPNDEGCFVCHTTKD